MAKKILRKLVVLSILMLLFGSCYQQPEPDDGVQNAVIPADSALPPVAPELLSPYTSQIAAFSFPSKTIYALGEATHGNRELAQLKTLVLQQLVEQHGVRAFVLEGDFGGCLSVNAYIQTGEGSAESAVSEIGFAIYRTGEMTEMVQWIREFNQNHEPAEQIRFYGFDMQRYDNNKKGLYAILDITSPELSQEYRSLLSEVSDANMFDLKNKDLAPVFSALEELNLRLAEQKDEITKAASPREYALAMQYATCILQNTQLRMASLNYGTLRDAFMADNVQWIYQYEQEFYAQSPIMISGHNGHIGKINATFGTKNSMGELLAETFQSEYYAIGTEFYESRFLAPDSKTGERQEFFVQNSGDNRLALLLHQLGFTSLCFDIRAAADDPALSGYLEEKQPFSSIGESFSVEAASRESMYTQKLSPAQTYDALIFFDSLGPSTMLPQGD